MQASGPTRLRRVIAGTGAIGLSLFALLAPSPASAHAVYEGWSVVYENNGKCVKDKSTIDHPTEALMTVLAETSAKKDESGPGYTIHCQDAWVQPQDGLEVKWVLFKETSRGDKVCESLGYWYKNPQSDYNLSSGAEYNAADPPCGSGYYFVKARGRVLVNGTWRPSKRGLGSGAHYFPCTTVNDDCTSVLPEQSGGAFYADLEPSTYGALNHLGVEVSTISNPLTNDVTWHPPGYDLTNVVYLNGPAISLDTDFFLNNDPCPTVAGGQTCNE